jgi:broad specificity phosphatase PhoE
VNGSIFAHPDRRVLGIESANDALRRFSSAVAEELARSEARNLVIVTHGTVISLFVAAHNSVDGFELWKKLQCPSLVVLEVPSLSLIEVVAEL